MPTVEELRRWLQGEKVDGLPKGYERKGEPEKTEGGESKGYVTPAGPVDVIVFHTDPADRSSKLMAYSTHVISGGPVRVLRPDAKEAIPPKRAPEEHLREIDVVFIRDDGWSLGCVSWHSYKEAESLWPDQWIGVMGKPWNKVISYTSFKEVRRVTGEHDFWKIWEHATQGVGPAKERAARRTMSAAEVASDSAAKRARSRRRERELAAREVLRKTKRKKGGRK